MPVYSDGVIALWKSAKRNRWQIENLSREVAIKHDDTDQSPEIRLEGEERRKMHIESREEFIHEKKMLLNPEYKKQYEQEQKLGIRHKLEFKFWEEVD